ncbi:pyridoxine 5'-phosphate synthase [Asticcacaulis biprosthecium C19]|uniref:Pyridoxine 5'-phosphate synthase n=1 Tax=Asticcacaulis biprosthecium C19 TaxID=715226 RepID=F4QQZ8_9CAUL|nr:pyridoxine 5'-phosphate synthase [Asticcacaulis biprosthecium]EGF90635.1 pyridoxine 5'-phosphate synthase [Asticcacaulis biprosthecium C19]
MRERIRLGLNVDHVATVRNARGGHAPDPIRAARLALQAGVDGITAHLREDRRHIVDKDVWVIKEVCDTFGKPLNFEMAVTDEMVSMALKLKPHAACLVPERRQERTTEGGLDVAGQIDNIGEAVRLFNKAGIRASLFIAADPAQVAAAAKVQAPVIEFHTGALCDAFRDQERVSFDSELKRLQIAVAQAHELGVEVHAGHGIDYETVPFIANIPHVRELNIGHFLIGEAIFIGLEAAVAKMRDLMDGAVGSLG